MELRSSFVDGTDVNVKMSAAYSEKSIVVRVASEARI